jgi:hypothetical protein
LALALACGGNDAGEETGAVARSGTESLAGSTEPAPAAAVDAKAMAALDRMGSYVRSLKAFQVVARTNQDEVLANGQGIQFSSDVDLLVRRPDRVRAEVTGDRHHRLFLYNGKDFTLYAGRLNYYATVAAPSTIAKLLDRLEQKYAIEMPLADLFAWGTDEASPAEITAAIDLGPSAVEGTTCQHYALRQPGLDWQVWIQNGEFPLPRKLVLTTLTDEARPQYTAVLTWNLAPSFNDAAFTFEPPAGATRIVLAEVGASDSAAGREEK